MGESLRNERSNEQETDDAAASVCSGEFHQHFRSGRREARWHLREEETNQNETKQDSMGNDEVKQNSMGHDSMKHDEMTEGKKQKKAHKFEKSNEWDAMGKDGMKQGDHVKQSDSTQKDDTQH